MFGTVGRSDSATDNAPLDMYDTTIMLRPREQWRAGVTYEKLIQEMDGKLQFPGLTNTWTMPVENRLDMELTGIKTAVGLKIQGPDLARIQDIGARIQEILSGMPETSSVFAERVSQGFYLNVEESTRSRTLRLNRGGRAARHHLGDWWSEHRTKRRGPRANPDCGAI